MTIAAVLARAHESGAFRILRRLEMNLDVSGHPLHTRSLTLRTTQRGDARHALHATVIDLRKCGFVPVAGILQAAGVVHHMTLEGAVDPATRTLDRIEARIFTPALEPTPLSQGECCRDPIGRMGDLAGTRLDTGFIPALREAFGGAKGCSHLLTLSQLMGSALQSSLDWDAAQSVALVDRNEGEPVYQRAVEIDGFDIGDRRMQIAVQLTDLHFVTAPDISPPMDRFGFEDEVRVLATINLAKGTEVERIEVWQRSRGYDEIDRAEWRVRNAEVKALEGQFLMAGMGRRLLDHFGDPSGDRAFIDALLSLAPGFIQCVASLSERWPHDAKESPSLMGISGRADSCYMWRAGGALDRVVEEEKARLGTPSTRKSG